MSRIRFLRDTRGLGETDICCFTGSGSRVERHFCRGESFDILGLHYTDGGALRLYAANDETHNSYVDVPPDAIVVDGRELPRPDPYRAIRVLAGTSLVDTGPSVTACIRAADRQANRARSQRPKVRGG